MKEWIKLLICGLCLITLLLHLLPDGKFVKYVRFYAGLLFFLTAVNPLLRFLQKDGELDRLLQTAFLKEEHYDLSSSIQGLSELKNERIQSVCQQEITRQMTQIAAAYHAGSYAAVQFAEDGYTPASVSIVLSDASDSANPSDTLQLIVGQIRAEICSIYSLTANQIHITGTGGIRL